MGKTTRSYPYGYFRNPRGHRQARARGDRAIPPSSYDDISYGREHWLAQRLLRAMRRRGWPDSKIAARLARKFGWPGTTIVEMLRNW